MTVLSSGLRAAGPRAEFGERPALSLAGLCCHPWQSWNSDRGFCQRRLPTRLSPKGDAVLSTPSNHSLEMGVLGATKGVMGLTRNLPHGPSIPSPGSVPWVTPNGCYRHECSSQGCTASGWRGSKPCIHPQWECRDRPRCWVPSQQLGMTQGVTHLRDSPATPCWHCKSHQCGLGRGKWYLSVLEENPKYISEGVGSRIRHADLLHLGF